MNEQVYYIEQWRRKSSPVTDFNFNLYTNRSLGWLKKECFKHPFAITVAYFRIKLKDKNG